MGTGCWVCPSVAQQGDTSPCSGREREGRGKENTPGAVPPNSVLLFSFLTIMTSFSAINLILSEPLAERKHRIKTALLIFDVKKLTPRIVSRRGEEDDL